MERLEPYSQEWQENRRAYLSKTHDFLDGESSIWVDGEEPAVFCSGIVQDTIDDLVAIQIANQPKAYPFPLVNEDLRQAVEMKVQQPFETYVEGVWSAIFQDIDERINIKRTITQVSKDARLCGIGVTKQSVKWNNELKDYDIDIAVIQPEDIGIDPSATTVEDAKYIFHRTYYTPYEAKRRWKSHKADIVGSIIGKEVDKENIDSGNSNIRRGSSQKENASYACQPAAKIDPG